MEELLKVKQGQVFRDDARIPSTSKYYPAKTGHPFIYIFRYIYFFINK